MTNKPGDAPQHSPEDEATPEQAAAWKRYQTARNLWRMFKTPRSIPGIGPPPTQGEEPPE